MKCALPHWTYRFALESILESKLQASTAKVGVFTSTEGSRYESKSECGVDTFRLLIAAHITCTTIAG